MYAPILSLSFWCAPRTDVRERARAGHIYVPEKRASCLGSPLFLYRRSRSRSSGRVTGSLVFAHSAATAVPSSAAAYPLSRSSHTSPPLRPRTSLAFDTRNRLVVLGRQTIVSYARRRTARARSFSLSLRILVHWLTQCYPSLSLSFFLSRPSVRPPSLPVPLSFSPVLSPRLFAPLHTLSRSTAAEPDTRTRQLRNNNNAVRSVCSVRVHHTTRHRGSRLYRPLVSREITC